MANRRRPDARGKAAGDLAAEVNLEKARKVAAELRASGRLALRLLSASLELASDWLAVVFSSRLVRGNFHLLLSALLLLGPVLSFWVSKYSVFSNANHYLYRKFLRSAWGWTCTFAGSFVLLLSLSARHPPSLALRHLSRLGLGALLWWGCRCLLTFLEDATGACFEPVRPAADGGPQGQPPLLLLLHQDQTKASCLRGNMVWRGYEVSQEVLILSWCCLLLAEEMSAFGAHLTRARPLLRPPPGGGPLRFLFLLCALLLALWVFLLLCLLAYFPRFPSQQLGGAMGYLGWRGLYQGWYRVKPSCVWSGPVPPGRGLFAEDVTKQTSGDEEEEQEKNAGGLRVRRQLGGGREVESYSRE